MTRVWWRAVEGQGSDAVDAHRIDVTTHVTIELAAQKFRLGNDHERRL